MFSLQFENMFITSDNEQIHLPKMGSEETDYSSYYDSLFVNDEIVYNRNSSYSLQDSASEDVAIEIVDQSGIIISNLNEIIVNKFVLKTNINVFCRSI